MVLTGTSAHGFEWIRGLMDGSAPNGLGELFETTIAVVIVPFLFLVPAVGEVTGDPANLLDGSVAVFGVWTATAFPGDAGAPYLLLLFCQLFAASSGFRSSAESGHFDLLLLCICTNIHATAVVERC